MGSLRGHYKDCPWWDWAFPMINFFWLKDEERVSAFQDLSGPEIFIPHSCSSCLVSSVQFCFFCRCSESESQIAPDLWGQNDSKDQQWSKDLHFLPVKYPLGLWAVLPEFVSEPTCPLFPVFHSLDKFIGTEQIYLFLV